LVLFDFLNICTGANPLFYFPAFDNGWGAPNQPPAVDSMPIAQSALKGEVSLVPDSVLPSVRGLLLIIWVKGFVPAVTTAFLWV
jgi:hypothetical protein